MSKRVRAWTIWGAAMLSCLLALGLLAASFNAPVPDSWGFRGFTIPFAVCFASLGLVIVLARANLIGWIFLIGGLLAGLQGFIEEYAIYGILQRPGSLPAPEYFAWLESWMWVVMVTLIVVFVPLWFPDGHFPSPRWRVLGPISVLVAVALMIGLALNEGPLNNAPFVSNPLSVRGVQVFVAGDPASGLGKPETNAWFNVIYSTLFVCAAAALWSLVGRFRRARGTERLQIKWFAFGAAVTTGAMIVGGLFQEFKIAQVLFIASILLIPISVAVAILRFRLYDIDVVINRALVYGTTVGIVGAGFVGAVLLLQTLLRPITAGSDLAIAASTLATVAAFQPLRRRVQQAIDRRFYRARYDASRTLDQFAGRLRNEVDLDALRSELLDVVGDTVRPTHAGVWLREVRP